MKTKSHKTYSSRAAVYFLIIGLTFLSPAKAENCKLAQDVKFIIYGERHNTDDANDLKIKLFGEAESGQTTYMSEMAPEAINTNPELKNRWLLMYANRVNKNIFDNVYAIDSDSFKFLDAVGTAYLELRDNGEIDSYLLIPLIGLLVDQKIIMNQPLKDLNADIIRSKIVSIHTKEGQDYIDVIKNTSNQNMMNFLSVLYENIAHYLKTQNLNFHNESLESFRGTADDYLMKGHIYRNTFMAAKIHDIACSGVIKTSTISINVGRNHLEGLGSELAKLMPGHNIQNIILKSAVNN